MNLDRARSLNGWLDEQDLVYLAEQAAKAQVIIEIGSAYGKSAAVMTDNSTAIIYCVDTWNGSPAELTTNHAEYANLGGDYVYAEFLRNHWGDITEGSIVPLRMQSNSAAGLFRWLGIRADFIFIDGDHSYDQVRADILNYIPLLAKGGIMAGHDYLVSAWPDVTKAVQEMIPDVTAPMGCMWQAPPYLL